MNLEYLYTLYRYVTKMVFMRGGVNKFSGFLINVDEGKRDRAND